MRSLLSISLHKNVQQDQEAHSRRGHTKQLSLGIPSDGSQVLHVISAEPLEVLDLMLLFIVCLLLLPPGSHTWGATLLYIDSFGNSSWLCHLGLPLWHLLPLGVCKPLLIMSPSVCSLSWATLVVSAGLCVSHLIFCCVSAIFFYLHSTGFLFRLLPKFI